MRRRLRDPCAGCVGAAGGWLRAGHPPAVVTMVYHLISYPIYPVFPVPPPSQIVLEGVDLNCMEVTVSTCSSVLLPDGSAKGKIYVSWSINLPDGDVSGRTGA